MSRVHDALRRSDSFGPPPPGRVPPPRRPGSPNTSRSTLDLAGLLAKIETIPYAPSPEASLVDASRPSEGPAEEFRSLRTRLNHLQTLQPIHTIAVTSASPAEGKSFCAVNLALSQSHLEGNLTLLCDFDFRRPVVHNTFQIPRSPGATDFLQGKVPLHEAIRHLEGTDMYIMPAGEAVPNPLELMNLPEVKLMIDELPSIFNWVIFDTPPLLFAADANLLSTLVNGLVLVVRLGTTTIDSMTRGIATLCQNNILGIIVNGAQKSELYSKYTYYHSQYFSQAE